MRKLAASLLLLPSLALASGYSLPNTNPRDLGLCASAVAAQRDSGAVFALPAALARLRGPYVSLGGGAVTVLNEWTDPTPGATLPPYAQIIPTTVPGPAEPATTNLDEQYTPFPNISFAYGGTIKGADDRGWGAGISVQPFGGAILKWPGDWAGRYRIRDINRQTFSAIASAGIEVVPQVRIGGGVMYYRTMQTLKLHGWQEFLPTPPSPVSPGAPDAEAKLDMDGGAWSYDVSIEIEPFKGGPLMIGVDYKHKATQNLDGDLTFTNVNPAARLSPVAPLYTATSATEQLTIPNLLNVGVAYRITKPLLATFTYTFDRWVVYGEDRFNLNTGLPFVVPREYHNGHTFRGGVEYEVTRALDLRAGVQRDLSGLKTSTYSPTLPDSDSWGVSLGGTFRFARAFSVDAAVFYANMDEVTSTNNGLEPGFYPPGGPPTPAGTVPVPVNGTFRGTYNPEAFVFTAAVAWHPGAK